MSVHFSKKSVLGLHDLSITKDKSHYIVGREKTEIFVLMPKLGVDIIQEIKKGHALDAVEKAVRAKHGFVDLRGFVHALIEHGFVKTLDKKSLHDEPAKKLYDFIQPKIARPFFSPLAYTVYFMLFLFALAVLIMNPQYFPRSRDYFFTDLYIILLPLSFLAGWFFVLLHEFGHYLAARSLQVKAKFGITHKLHFLVAITDVTNLYAVSREKRFRVIFAGMLADCLVIAVSLLLLFFSDMFFHFSLLLYGFLKFIILLEFFGLLWQFLFFLKTDIYYAFEHWLGIYNLLEKTKLYIKSKFQPLFVFHPHPYEKKVIQWYALFVIVGLLITIGFFVFYSIPILYALLRTSIGNIVRGFIAMNFTFFYDKLLFLLFFSVNQSLLIYAIMKKQLHKPHFYFLLLILFLATNYFVLFFLILMMIALIKSAFVIYVLTLLIGIVSCIFLIKIISKSNDISTIKIIPEVFVFAVSLIYAFVLVNFTRYFIMTMHLSLLSSLLLGICYAVGIAIGYLYVYEKHEHRHRKSIARKIAKG
ncbi:RIP metalloprotease [Candidatus Woesearchaeota archaeon]|nr:MAG: RIP metalloprotease [Candidatus Woesearchaeota archaeon]